MSKSYLNYFISTIVFFGLVLSTRDAFALGDRPMGGKITSIPSLEILKERAVCLAKQMTVGEVTITSTWNGETDNGNSQTWTYLPNVSPKPTPKTYYLEKNTRSKTKYDAQSSRWALGLYQTEFKKIGTCKVTTTITYPPMSSSVDIPSFLQISKVIMYGAGQ